MLVLLPKGVGGGLLTQRDILIILENWGLLFLGYAVTTSFILQS